MSEQLEFFVVPSPCKNICQSNEKGYCIGCMRNREERFGWLAMTDAQKRNVLRLCQQRFIRLRRAARQQDNHIPVELPDLQQPLFD